VRRRGYRISLRVQDYRKLGGAAEREAAGAKRRAELCEETAPTRPTCGEADRIDVTSDSFRVTGCPLTLPSPARGEGEFELRSKQG
jgi:hypothetical protein